MGDCGGHQMEVPCSRNFGSRAEWSLNCRVKRIEQVGDLESEKTDEQREMEKMASDNTSMRIEIDKVYRYYEALKTFAYQNSIPLPAELETL